MSRPFRNVGSALLRLLLLLSRMFCVSFFLALVRCLILLPEAGLWLRLRNLVVLGLLSWVVLQLRNLFVLNLLSRLVLQLRDLFVKQLLGL